MRNNNYKKIFYFLLSVFCLISCKNANQVKEIEILTYFNNARNFSIYSNIDKNGYTETLFKSETSNKIDNCQIRVSKSLMDSIITICENKSEKDFIFKSSKQIWYCGFWHSVKVSYENGKTIIFKYPYANKENKQFLPFQSLSNQIQKDSLKAMRLNLGQLGEMINKQQNFSDISFQKDSIFIANYLKKRK